MQRLLIPALLAVAGAFAIAETAQAQVRIGIGVGGGGRGYYGGGPYYSGGGYYGSRGFYPGGSSIYLGIGGSAYPRYYTPYYGGPAYYDVAPRVYVQPAPTYAVPAEPAADHGYIRVLVPDPNAQVLFDGNPTKQTGTSRLFHTPRLEIGSSYSYRIRASWTENGEPVIQERVVSVTPGQTAVASFLPNSEALPSPK